MRSLDAPPPPIDTGIGPTARTPEPALAAEVVALRRVVDELRRADVRSRCPT